MLQELIEILIYAAAMDLYKRNNLSFAYNSKTRPMHLPRKVTNAMLDMVAWNARPIWLVK